MCGIVPFCASLTSGLDATPKTGSTNGDLAQMVSRADGVFGRGRVNGAWVSGTKGGIDEVRVTKRHLSADEFMVTGQRPQRGFQIYVR